MRGEIVSSARRKALKERMNSPNTQVVVVGGGLAGVQACMSLRSENFTGHIVLLGDESSHPYQRPPLSKAYLKGKVDEDGLQIVKPPSQFWSRWLSAR